MIEVGVAPVTRRSAGVGGAAAGVVFATTLLLFPDWLSAASRARTANVDVRPASSPVHVNEVGDCGAE